MNKRIFAAIGFIFAAFTSGAQSLDEAKRLTENEQYDAATSIFKILLSKEPNNGAFYYFYGDNLLLGENADSARIIFEQGLQQDPANLLNKIGRAKELLNRIDSKEAKAATEREPGNADLKTRSEEAVGFVAEAMKLIDEAVASAPAKSVQIHIEAADALIHYKNKNLDKAKQLLDKAVTIDAKNPEIQLLYGDIYTELNNGTLAAEYYNKALDLNKNYPRAIVSKGRLYKRSTNFEGAAGEFLSAISMDPNYAPAYRELGETYFRQGKLEKAKEEYRKYLELSKSNCKARMRYGGFLYLSKDYTGAITEIDQVLQRCNPMDPQPWRIKAVSYYELKEYAKGLEAAEKVFQIVPEDRHTPKDYEYYGKLLIATNKDSLGIIELKKSYAIDPTRPEILSDLANAYIKTKNYPEAIKAINEKIANGKDVKSADYFNLGRSYYFNTQFSSADSAFMKVNEVSPKYASGYLWRAKANAQIDSTSENGLAKPHYEKYIEIAEADSSNAAKYNSGLTEAYGYLAYYYILKKDNAMACTNLVKKSALQLEADDLKNVQQAIKQLGCK